MKNKHEKPLIGFIETIEVTSFIFTVLKYIKEIK